MLDREKVINGLKELHGSKETMELISEAIALLKEHKSEYENGFNDAMLGKQELMYEGTDGKWHKKDW